MIRRGRVTAIRLAILGAVSAGATADGLAQATEAVRDGFRLSAPVQDTDDLTRVLLVYDMEGVAGVDSEQQVVVDSPDLYARGRELLTADVNAVVEGLFAGGATEVDVRDAHGSGNPEPDVVLDALDTRARFLPTEGNPYTIVESGRYDAIAVVGMHAKGGSRGFISHTYNSSLHFLVNGHSLTETEIVALLWGRVGVPVVLVTGDDALKQDLADTMPWVEYVEVKTADGVESAQLRSLDEVYEEMSVKASIALERRGEMRVLEPTLPITAGLRVDPPVSLRYLSKVPGVLFENETVLFQAPSMDEAFEGMMGLVSASRISGLLLLRDVVREQPNADELFEQYFARRHRIWVEVESGTYEPPVEDSR